MLAPSTCLSRALAPVKGRYFSDNKKTARSLHRLRAIFLLSLKYLPFTGVKRSFNISPCGIHIMLQKSGD